MRGLLAPAAPGGLIQCLPASHCRLGSPSGDEIRPNNAALRQLRAKSAQFAGTPHRTTEFGPSRPQRRSIGSTFWRGKPPVDLAWKTYYQVLVRITELNRMCGEVAHKLRFERLADFKNRYLEWFRKTRDLGE